jgi:hypothetical protein
VALHVRHASREAKCRRHLIDWQGCQPVIDNRRRANFRPSFSADGAAQPLSERVRWRILAQARDDTIQRDCSGTGIYRDDEVPTLGELHAAEPRSGGRL